VNGIVFRTSSLTWCPDIYLTTLGIVLTLIYAAGLVFRPCRRIARLGGDSLAVLILYGLGMIGLFTVSNMR
jgi:cation:H+ antiporter